MTNPLREVVADALLPCPFCGESNLDQWPNETLDASGANCVRCPWCHGAAPMKTWNRRTLTQQQGGEQEAGIYCEARECENCYHVGINDSSTVDDACLECDWSGPSPQEDKCPACHQTGVMTAACPHCNGRYRLIAESEIPTLRTKQPAASEGDGRDWRLKLRDELRNTSKQAAGEAVAWTTVEQLERVSLGEIGFIARQDMVEPAPNVPLYTTPPRHPADEGKDALCIHCGRPTMHIGNVCFTCSKAAKNALHAGTP